MTEEVLTKEFRDYIKERPKVELEIPSDVIKVRVIDVIKQLNKFVLDYVPAFLVMEFEDKLELYLIGDGEIFIYKLDKDALD